jgi:hypothetical protein
MIGKSLTPNRHIKTHTYQQARLEAWQKAYDNQQKKVSATERAKTIPTPHHPYDDSPTHPKSINQSTPPPPTPQIQEEKDFINRFRSNNARAPQVKSRELALEKLMKSDELVKRPPFQVRPVLPRTVGVQRACYIHM